MKFVFPEVLAMVALVGEEALEEVMEEALAFPFHPNSSD
jgi:hypothetical protein